MPRLDTTDNIAVIGAGTMGAGIAQIAATRGHTVFVVDSSTEQLNAVQPKLQKIFNRLVEKERMTAADADATLERIHPTSELKSVRDCTVVIEAVVEKLSVKEQVFRELEPVVGDDTVLATNTSSLPIAAIGSACKNPNRVLGVHFFNPAPLMPLVEIIPSLLTLDEVTTAVVNLIDSWGKTTVVAKDTPGFIVNRIARPFYGEALRLFEEGVAEPATIDWAMRELGGFRMGPFELMDLIGNDINCAVSETVFEAFYYDPRYRPSLQQKRMVQAGLLGRKSGRGFYRYGDDAGKASPATDEALGEEILQRILAMLINEAADALLLGVASREDIDLAMTKGVNYPKGLLAWADELGIEKVLTRLSALQEEYGEDRYRASALLRRMVREGKTFYG